MKKKNHKPGRPPKYPRTSGKKPKQKSDSSIWDMLTKTLDVSERVKLAQSGRDY